MNPLSAVAGTSVTLTGDNFGPTPESNIVQFPGAVRATVTVASTSNLLVTVPAGTKFGPVTVTVNRRTGSSPKPFTPTFHTSEEFGPASFQPRLTFIIPLRTGLPLVEDVDGDGKLDLGAWSYETENTLSLFRNASAPGKLDTNSFAPRFDLFENGQFVSNLGIAADLDGDGRLDLIMPSRPGNLRLAQSVAQPGKLDANTFLLPISILTRGTVALAKDFDGDGRPDIALHEQPSFDFLIYQNIHSRGPFKPASFRLAANINTDVVHYGNAAADDLDGDGKPDLVTAVGDRIYVRRNIGVPNELGPGSFDSPVEFFGPPEPLSLVIGDLDGDGRPELIAAGYHAHLLCVFRNLGSPGSWDTNSFAPRQDFSTGAIPGRMALGDVDGDGQLDLVIPLEMEDVVQVWINRSTLGHVEFASPVRFATDTQPLTAVIADLDGDGPPEIITANFQGTLSVLRNALPPAAPTNSPTTKP